MPIDCPIKMPRLTEDEMRTIDYEVMSHAFASQNDVGRLCDESVYKFNLANRLNAVGITAIAEVPIQLTFQSFSKTLSMDLVVDNKVPYELKAVSELTIGHKNQLLNYLLMTNACRGKVVNFRANSVTSRFVNSSLEHTDRHQFTVNAKHWNGDTSFQDLVTSLVHDWGTSLDLSLYGQAITDCLGGAERVIRQLPMMSSDGTMGNQRFHLADDHTAFRLTSFPEPDSSGYATHLAKMLRPSPLDRMYWVNIARHELQFQTVQV